MVGVEVVDDDGSVGLIFLGEEVVAGLEELVRSEGLARSVKVKVKGVLQTDVVKEVAPGFCEVEVGVERVDYGVELYLFETGIERF